MDSFDPTVAPARVQHILSLLHPALPVSLPLYRRVQFAHFTPTSRVTLSRITPGEPWLVCFTDPDRGPETQLFIYGSWENAGDERIPTDPRARALVAELIAHIKAEGLFAPSLRTERTQASINGRERAGYDATTDARHLVLCGGVHASTALLLADMGLLEPAYVDADSADGMPEKYHKWIFDLRDGSDGGEDKLPKGLAWGALKTKHYALVRSRTAIQRQDRTLRMLPDVAIFAAGKDDAPVAWMFLGVDSSLTTLHVEPEYRGKGLAKAMARKAWRDHLGYYTSKHEADSGLPKERWGHADVATSNDASNAVCRSLGGTVMWYDYWMTIDLTRLAEHE